MDCLIEAGQEDFDNQVDEITDVAFLNKLLVYIQGGEEPYDTSSDAKQHLISIVRDIKDRCKNEIANIIARRIADLETEGEEDPQGGGRRRRRTRRRKHRKSRKSHRKHRKTHRRS